MKLQIVRPAPQWLESYHDACLETFGHVHNSYIIHDPAHFHEWRHTIFQEYADAEQGTNLPPGYLPSATFWLIYGNDYAGTLNIRLRLNSVLAEYGGHLGLVLRMNLRGKGLARNAAELGIARAKDLGVDPVLITCIEDNLPSLRTFEGIPDCRKTERAVVCADGIIRAVRRFWF